MADDNQNVAGKKSDAGKPRLELISPIATFKKARVYTFGAEKYGKDNWRKGLAWGRVIGACLRHIFAWLSGEDNDEETGLSHLAHAACCLDFLLEYEETHKELDDRKERLQLRATSTDRPLPDVGHAYPGKTIPIKQPHHEPLVCQLHHCVLMMDGCCPYCIEGMP